MPQMQGTLGGRYAGIDGGTTCKEERDTIQVSPRCDWLHVECQNCGFTFPVIFHRSLKYKKMSDEMRDKFLDPTTHSKTGGKEDRDI